MSNKIDLASLLKSSDSPAEPSPGKFTITPYSITIGNGSEVYLLSHITRFGKYKVNENKVRNIIFFIVFSILTWVSFSSSRMFGPTGNTLGLLFLCVAGFFLYLLLKPGLFAFGFESSSGSARYFHSSDELYIDSIVTTISKYMSNNQGKGIEVNINNGKINTFQLDKGNILYNEGTVQANNIQSETNRE